MLLGSNFGNCPSLDELLVCVPSEFGCVEAQGRNVLPMFARNDVLVVVVPSSASHFLVRRAFLHRLHRLKATLD